MKAAVYPFTVTEMRRSDNDVATQNCFRSGRLLLRLLVKALDYPSGTPAKRMPS